MEIKLGQKAKDIITGFTTNERIFALRLAVLRCFTCNEVYYAAPGVLRGLKKTGQWLRCGYCHKGLWPTSPPIGGQLN